MAEAEIFSPAILAEILPCTQKANANEQSASKIDYPETEKLSTLVSAKDNPAEKKCRKPYKPKNDS